MLPLLLKMHSDRYHAANLCQPPRFFHSPPGPTRLPGRQSPSLPIPRPPFPPFHPGHPAGSTPGLRSRYGRHLFVASRHGVRREVRSVNVNAVRYLAVAPINGSGVQIQVHSTHRCITLVQKCILQNYIYYYISSI